MFYNMQKGKIKGVFSVPKQYIAIDLKSFYASVECVERGLDPMTTHLVVADASRTEKTICLAVSPALKAHGISGRARLFEVVQRVTEGNALRKAQNKVREFTGEALDSRELAEHPDWKLGYHVAKPRMAHYMECSARIYSVYLRYVAPEDIHPYSIDEVFIDATAYLKLYGVDPRGFAKMLMQAVMEETGITATAGVGTNLYLCKIAMDIMAKRIPPDAQGARIACLDELSPGDVGPSASDGFLAGGAGHLQKAGASGHPDYGRHCPGLSGPRTLRRGEPLQALRRQRRAAH